jgi:hypothetical protein
MRYPAHNTRREVFDAYELDAFGRYVEGDVCVGGELRFYIGVGGGEGVVVKAEVDFIEVGVVDVEDGGLEVVVGGGCLVGGEAI